MSEDDHAYVDLAVPGRRRGDAELLLGLGRLEGKVDSVQTTLAAVVADHADFRRTLGAHGETLAIHGAQLQEIKGDQADPVSGWIIGSIVGSALIGILAIVVAALASFAH